MKSPVVAQGFDRPLPSNGVMAIEPKLVFTEGSIGIEDTWLKTESGLQRLTLSGNNEWLTNC